MSILLTGSEGKIGQQVKEYFSKTYDIVELDYNNKISVDATDELSVKHFFENLENKEIKYIINCIGIPDSVPLTNTSLLDIDVKYFKKMIDVNLNSIFIIIKECYRKYKHCLKSIINISSLYSVVSPRIDIYDGKIKNPAYTASKHGLIGLTKHLAVILAVDNININCISPGGVGETIDDEKFIKNYCENVPLKTTISVNDVIKTITYLLCVDSMTGQNIIIDGGYSII